MKNYLNKKIFQIISEIVTSEDIQAFVIGGYVRDIFLKRPSTDIDIVTVGSGIDLAKKIANKIGRHDKITIFKNFGTAMLEFENMEIEFVGARKESYDRNSRKPIVENGTLEEDPHRRDFTINAMAMSLNKNNFGELTDPFHGLDDLENKIIKTPLEPNITFSDDPLRMMRAIRFATQLGFTIEENTFAAIKSNRERIHIISKERIVEELNKIMLSKKPSVGFYLLDETGLLELIFPELHRLKGVEECEGIKHKDNFIHTLKVLDNICQTTDNLWLRWAALLHDIAKPHTKLFVPKQGWTFYAHNFVGSKLVPTIFKKMKLPLNEKMKYIQKIVSLHMRPIILAEEEVTDSAVRRLLFDAGEDIEDLMLLCEADITSGNNEKVERFLNNFQLVRQKLKEVEEKDAVRNWQPPISGEEIIKTFNILPSKNVGIIKDAIKDAILDGVISNNYEAAYKLMIEKGKELGLSPVG